jgi:hypothetical protein
MLSCRSDFAANADDAKIALQYVVVREESAVLPIVGMLPIASRERIRWRSGVYECACGVCERNREVDGAIR